MKEALRIASLPLLVALIYANTLGNDFTMDDGLYVFQNPQVTTATLGGLLTPHKVSNVFRPMTFATFALNWKLGGDDPLGYHLINLLLHAGVTVLLYLLVTKLLEDSATGATAAFAAALVFAAHPLHTEAVASIAGRAELLAAGFLLAAWLLHLCDHPIWALTCFVLALLSKESAVIFLPLVMVGDYARGKWKSGARYAVIAGVTIFFLGLLWKVQGGRFGPKTISRLDNPLAALPSGWRILNAFRVAWKYAALHVYPANLSCDYSFNAIAIYLDWRHTLPALVAALAVVGAWIWVFGKRQTGLILAGVIYLGAFATTANILIPTGTIMGERLAYLPSAGFCLLAALAWNGLRDRHGRVAIAALAAVVAAFGMRAIVRNQDWHDNLSLYSAAVRVVPESAKMHGGLGGEYMASGQWNLAAAEFQTALRINPDYPDVLATYGVLEAWRGNTQAAGAMMERAVFMSNREDPNYDFMVVNYAALLIQTDHLDGALDVLNREIAESPGYGRAWSNRAAIHYKRGERAAARTDAEAALRLEPENSQAQNVLRLLSAPEAGSPPK